MQELSAFFAEEKIEAFAVLRYEDLSVIAPQIMEREDFLPRSVILFLLPYYAGETENLSVYSASLDYHLCIREITEKLCARLSKLFPGSRAKGYGDHSPIDERSAALRAGLGILGDNGLLITERYGSYVFIADVITDIAPEALGAISPGKIATCEHCGACRRACPTGILRGENFEGKPDCLSAITQRKGDLSEGEKTLMRQYGTAWGCDLCQSVCPHNRAPRKTPIAFFYRGRIRALSRDFVDSLGKEEFSRYAFAWRGRKTVLRNLEILSENGEKNS